MVTEKMLIAKEAIIQQTDKPVSVFDTWDDLGLDSLDMFNAVIYIEDEYGYSISTRVFRKNYDKYKPAIAQLVNMIEESN